MCVITHQDVTKITCLTQVSVHYADRQTFFETLANPHVHLEPPGQELVLHLQEVALVGLGFERLVNDGKLRVILNVLPSSIAMTVKSPGLRFKLDSNP